MRTTSIIITKNLSFLALHINKDKKDSKLIMKYGIINLHLKKRTHWVAPIRDFFSFLLVSTTQLNENICPEPKRKLGCSSEHKVQRKTVSELLIVSKRITETKISNQFLKLL